MLSQYKARVMCLTQGKNAVTPVRLETAAPWSRIHPSTFEPLRSHEILWDVPDLPYVRNKDYQYQASHLNILGYEGLSICNENSPVYQKV